MELVHETVAESVGTVILSTTPRPASRRGAPCMTDPAKVNAHIRDLLRHGVTSIPPCVDAASPFSHDLDKNRTHKFIDS